MSFFNFPKKLLGKITKILFERVPSHRNTGGLLFFDKNIKKSLIFVTIYDFAGNRFPTLETFMLSRLLEWTHNLLEWTHAGNRIPAKKHGLMIFRYKLLLFKPLSSNSN